MLGPFTCPAPQYQLWASQNVLAALGLPDRPAE